MTIERSEAYLDRLFGPGAGRRHAAFIDRLESAPLRETLHGYHLLEADTAHLSVEENYLLGLAVLCAQRSFGPAAMFAKTLRHLGTPRARILEVVTRLSMWVGGVPAAEAAAHVQKALREYDERGAASLEGWFPPAPPALPTPPSPGAPGAEVAVTHRPGRPGPGGPGPGPVAGAGTAGEAAAAAGAAMALPLDAGDESSFAAAFARLGDAWGRLDFLVHAIVHVPAGLLARPLAQVTRAEWDLVVGTGAHSLVAACRHAAPLLARSDAARVVALSSSGGRRALPHYHLAGIAKAALESAVRYLALELGPAGVLVNAVSASLVPTDGALGAVGEAAAAATRAHLARRAPTRRATDAADVADAVAWLCSPFARNISAGILTVDGGFETLYL